MNNDDPILRLLKAQEENAAKVQEELDVYDDASVNEDAAVVEDAQADDVKLLEAAGIPDTGRLLDEAEREINYMISTESIGDFAPRPKPVRKKGSYSSDMIRRIMNADRAHPGVRLARVCITKHIPVSEVAERMNVTRPTVYGWFTGEQYPKDYQLHKIRELLLTYTVVRK